MIFEDLSVKEKAVALELSKGKTFKEAGIELNLSPKTVENYKYEIVSKLGWENHELLQNHSKILEWLHFAELSSRRIRNFDDIADQLNDLPFIRSCMRIHSDCYPVLTNLGELPITDQERLLAAEYVVNRKFPEDDWCAVFREQPNWRKPSPTIGYHVEKYSAIKAAEEIRGQKFTLVSANGLIVCEETEQLILHDRSFQNEAYPRTIHTPGGGFIPPHAGLGSHSDSNGLDSTISREIREETGIESIEIKPYAVTALIDEFEINYLQLAKIGIRVDKMYMTEFSNWEGKKIILSFAELQDWLSDTSKWTASGWCHVMLWLALGCPGIYSSPTFRGLGPSDLYDSVLTSIKG